MTEEKAKLEYYKEKCTVAYEQLTRARKVYEATWEEWNECRELYEQLDRKLAETDGRLHVYPPGKSGKQPTKAPELTKDQLLAILESLTRRSVMRKSDEPISSFRDYCHECNKETLLYVVNEKPGHEPTGLLGTQELECSECGTRWWV